MVLFKEYWFGNTIHKQWFCTKNTGLAIQLTNNGFVQRILVWQYSYVLKQWFCTKNTGLAIQLTNWFCTKNTGLAIQLSIKAMVLYNEYWICHSIKKQ